jgi:hypothetical protein
MELYDELETKEIHTLADDHSRKVSESFWIQFGITALISFGAFVSAAYVTNLATKYSSNGLLSGALIVTAEVLILFGVVSGYVGLPVIFLRFLVALWPVARLNFRFRLRTIIKFSIKADEHDLELARSLSERYEPEVLNFAARRLHSNMESVRSVYRVIWGLISFAIFATGLLQMHDQVLGTLLHKRELWPALIECLIVLLVLVWIFVGDFKRYRRLEQLIQVLELSVQRIKKLSAPDDICSSAAPARARSVMSSASKRANLPFTLGCAGGIYPNRRTSATDAHPTDVLRVLLRSARKVCRSQTPIDRY